MKGKLIRVCVVANDATETMKDFNDLSTDRSMTST